MKSSATDGIFHMCCGSSQGLPHSGSVNILCFLHAFELGGIGIARPVSKRSRGIRHYQRAIDNMLFITDSHCNHEQLHHDINAAISPYTCKIEESGEHSVDFFDFVVLKSPSDPLRKLAFRPTLRNKGPVLSFFSAHQTSLHLSWPIAYIRRLYKRSSSLEFFRVAKNQFIQRLRDQCVPELIIQNCIDNTDYFIPYQRNSGSTPGFFRDPSRTFLVLPYHPFWCGKLDRTVQEFVTQPHYVDLLRDAWSKKADFPVTVSWKQQRVPLGISLVKW